MPIITPDNSAFEDPQKYVKLMQKLQETDLEKKTLEKQRHPDPETTPTVDLDDLRDDNENKNTSEIDIHTRQTFDEIKAISNESRAQRKTRILRPKRITAPQVFTPKSQ